MPPSWEELCSRLERRGEDSADTIEQRLLKCGTELAQAKSFHYVIINELFERALFDLKTIVHAQRLKYARSAAPRLIPSPPCTSPIRSNRFMARITAEDSLEKIPNRFQLVLAATYRARMLSQGHTPKVESRNKPAVTALREIAARARGPGTLKKVPT